MIIMTFRSSLRKKIVTPILKSSSSNTNFKLWLYIEIINNEFNKQ